MRSHVDVSATLGLSRLEAVLEAREELSEVTTIVLVAFPQLGILAAPGTASVLEEALRLGAEAIGGIDPEEFDGDREAHLAVVFDLATRYGRRVVIHLHETGESGLATMRAMAARTCAEWLQGRVCISHGFALATGPAASVEETIEQLSAAEVGFVTNVPGDGLMPPIDRLLGAGVRAAIGSDNIRDSWSPFGRGDQLERSALAAYLLGWLADDQLERSLTLVTEAPAMLLGETPAALGIGDAADIVLVPASCGAEALVTHLDRRTVYRQGVGVFGPALDEVAC